jgi:serine/threonine protein kinase
LAPEILAAKGHGKSVDWWSLGVLVCEMLTGDPPFYNKNTQAMYRLILHSKPTYKRPLKKDAMGLLSGLLERQVETRWTGSDIRNSNFFEEYAQKNGTVAKLDWDKVLRKEYSPVFVPPPFDLKLNQLNIDPYYMKKSTKETVRCCLFVVSLLLLLLMLMTKFFFFFFFFLMLLFSVSYFQFSFFPPGCRCTEARGCRKSQV